jgi:aminoglycoside 3-N-acetyltransferase
MLTYRELLSALRQLDIPRQQPLIAHASLSAFGEIQGGAETLLGALLGITDQLMMPTFTYRTMLVPQEGPPDNGLTYGDPRHRNDKAEFFHPQMPADPAMGILAETLRQHPHAARSTHPILSFAGIQMQAALEAQSLPDPFAPIGVLMEAQAWVLLLGVDHTCNTSIHYGEQLVGRKQFVRWALSPQGVITCPVFPGCSAGFEAIAPRLKAITQQIQIGQALVRAVPLASLIERVQALIQTNPFALLCEEAYCQRCAAVRKAIAAG